jgi:hypothetical protein
MLDPVRFRSTFLIAAVGCAACVSACGSSSNRPGPGASRAAKGESAFVSFSQCMRSHGVPNFPDPQPGGGIRITPSSGLDPRSPAFQTAQKQCGKLLPGGGPGHANPSEEPQLLRLAACMRSHGLTGFPDPTVAQNGGPPSGPALVINGYEFKFGAGLNPMSPAFQNAMKACGGPGPP